MPRQRFLKQYEGQTTQELLDLAGSFRVDSLVMAFEKALLAKADRLSASALSWPETVVLAVEATEREVNNGGWNQFFRNSSYVHALHLPRALEDIGCPATADIAARALAALPIDEPPTLEAIDRLRATLRDSEHREWVSETVSVIRAPLFLADFSALDDEYLEAPEPIADRLFEYICAQSEHVSVP